MNRYAVTHHSIALYNCEVEVDPAKADQVREEIAKRQPVFGRDWDYKPVEKLTVIEADAYSVSEQGVAHFYKSNPEKGCRDILIATIMKPLTITLLPPDDEEVPAKTGGGGGGSGWYGSVQWTSVAGGVPVTQWYGDGGFPPGTFSIDQVRAREAMDKVEEPDRHALPLSLDELVKLRAGLKAMDPGKQSAVYSDLDAKLYATQVILNTRKHKAPPKPETPVDTEFRQVSVLVRYRREDGKVMQKWAVTGPKKDWVIDLVAKSPDTPS